MKRWFKNTLDDLYNSGLVERRADVVILVLGMASLLVAVVVMVLVAAGVLT